MTQTQGIDLAAIAAHNAQQEAALRLVAIQLAVQGRRENDGNLLDLADDILAWLTAEPGND